MASPRLWCCLCSSNRHWLCYTLGGQQAKGTPGPQFGEVGRNFCVVVGDGKVGFGKASLDNDEGPVVLPRCIRLRLVHPEGHLRSRPHALHNCPLALFHNKKTDCGECKLKRIPLALISRRSSTPQYKPCIFVWKYREAPIFYACIERLESFADVKFYA